MRTRNIRQPLRPCTGVLAQNDSTRARSYTLWRVSLGFSQLSAPAPTVGHYTVIIFALVLATRSRVICIRLSVLVTRGTIITLPKVRDERGNENIVTRRVATMSARNGFPPLWTGTRVGADRRLEFARPPTEHLPSVSTPRIRNVSFPQSVFAFPKGVRAFFPKSWRLRFRFSGFRHRAVRLCTNEFLNIRRDTVVNFAKRQISQVTAPRISGNPEEQMDWRSGRRFEKSERDIKSR